MKTFLQYAGRTLAILMAVLFVLALPPTFAAFDAGQVFFSPDKMRALLDEAALRSQLVPLGMSWTARKMAAEVSLQPDTPDYTTLVSALSQEQWQTLRQLLLPDEILLDLLHSTLNGFYLWLDSADATPDIVWVMQPLQRALSGVNGQKAVEVVYQAMPACTQAQIEDFQRRLGQAGPGEEVYYNLCRFPEPWKSDQMADYLASVQAAAETIPPVLKPVDMLDLPPRAFPRLKRALLLMRRISRYGWMLPLALLWLIAALQVRTFRSLGRWWGIPLALGGALTAALGAVIPPVVHSWFLFFTAQLPELLAQESISLLDAFARAVMRPLWWQGGVVLLAGVLTMLGAWWAARAERSPAETAA